MRVLCVQYVSDTDRNIYSEERFLKGEAVNSNMYGPLRDGPDFTIVSSKTGKIPENPPLSTRKQQQVYILVCLTETIS